MLKGLATNNASRCIKTFGNVERRSYGRRVHIALRLCSGSPTERNGTSILEKYKLGAIKHMKRMKHAENIAKSHGKSKIAVIAGIGTRNYYRKLGYRLHKGEGGFLIKSLYFKAEGAFWFLFAAVATFLILFLFAPSSLPEALTPKILGNLFHGAPNIEL